jgi:hypothetical protein
MSAPLSLESDVFRTPSRTARIAASTLSNCVYAMVWII